jgi:hypothetical protein
MSEPGAGHVRLAEYERDIGRTYPVKTASAVLEPSETA